MKPSIIISPLSLCATHFSLCLIVLKFILCCEVESYNLEKNQWIAHPSLNQKRGSLSGICLNEKIFAIGGGNGVQCFSEVEVFDTNVGMWIPSKSMQYRVFQASL